MHTIVVRPNADVLAFANLLHAMFMRSIAPARAAREELETLPEMCAHRTDSVASAHTRRAKDRADPARRPPFFSLALRRGLWFGLV